MIDQTKTRMTAAEFLALPETNQPTELIEGEMMMAPSPVPQHQDVITDVTVILKRMTKTLGGKVFVAPLDVYLDDNHVVQPDLMWVAEGGQCKITDTHLEGVPDLVVEVLSPGTARRDKTVKFRLYQQHGAREYWMIDPAAEYIEVWTLQEERFVQQGVYGPDENFESAVLGGQNVTVGVIFGRE